MRSDGSSLLTVIAVPGCTVSKSSTVKTLANIAGYLIFRVSRRLTVSRTIGL